MSELDVESSESRQHYIDTGTYLPKQQHLVLSDEAMAAIKAITSSPDLDPATAFVATILFTFGCALWDRAERFDPRSVAIPSEQWEEICGQLTQLKGSVINQVNYGLDWVNQGPSSFTRPLSNEGALR